MTNLPLDVLLRIWHDAVVRRLLVRQKMGKAPQFPKKCLELDAYDKDLSLVDVVDPKVRRREIEKSVQEMENAGLVKRSNEKIYFRIGTAGDLCPLVRNAIDK